MKSQGAVFLPVLILCAAFSFHAFAADFAKQADALADSADDFAGDVEDYLKENDRWEPRGRDAVLWKNVRGLKDDAETLKDAIEGGGSRSVIPVMVQVIGEKLRAIRVAMYAERLEPGSRENFWRLEGFYLALAVGNDRRGIRTERERDREESHDREESRVEDEAPSEAAPVPTGPTGVASHVGQTEYIKANSAARRHLTRTLGLKNANIETQSIEPKGGNYLVILSTPTSRYELTVDIQTGAVVKEKVR